ncbi:hypothetical protein PHYSODRAFT_287018 [Phytophthora sojae]|uniref:RxLR effector protein n=2 Tax=Phytophthora sojae TaxID=67593 RepID=G4ZZF8_PHYSP|nr:hypothetical protein PHYSODRAFT_287018 [Phytophthora sojae]AEK80972.1 Avh226 [Phytophthora sojae]AEK80973.1 Avh226 [Phytophthora sojae]AEK80974.1 Avh226 [Phytophthora sojae]EGZ10358.1 hypothetical protein PHYSODRAFT_287018 [Phytophthora sojae]|eukprot:XP_009533103.1 hypothetical protein PHYSODRAFT_287018 [Phytophthora sojae]
MRLIQFFLLVLVTFAVCCSALASAEDPNQMKNTVSTGQHQAATRYLKGSKTTTDMTSADEERFTPQFGQYWGIFRLPSFAKLPGAQQVAFLRQKFGKGAGKVINLWFRLVRRSSKNSGI